MMIMTMCGKRTLPMSSRKSIALSLNTINTGRTRGLRGRFLCEHRSDDRHRGLYRYRREERERERSFPCVKSFGREEKKNGKIDDWSLDIHLFRWEMRTNLERRGSVLSRRKIAVKRTGRDIHAPRLWPVGLMMMKIVGVKHVGKAHCSLSIGLPSVIVSSQHTHTQQESESHWQEILRMKVSIDVWRNESGYLLCSSSFPN